jgi:hypothetical protein
MTPLIRKKGIPRNWIPEATAQNAEVKSLWPSLKAQGLNGLMVSWTMTSVLPQCRGLERVARARFLFSNLVSIYSYNKVQNCYYNIGPCKL